MKRFTNGQRVLVRACAASTSDGYDRALLDPPRPGTVARLRRADDLAWIRLDERGPEAAHPFQGDEGERARDVLAAPEDCEPLQ